MVKFARLPANWQQTQLLERYWDQTMTTLESILTQILEIPVIKEGLFETQQAASEAQEAAAAAAALSASAQTSADTAQGTANTAQAAVTSVTKEQSLVNSYVTNSGGTLISADSTGVVTILTHDRVYGDPVANPTVSVTGAALSTGALATQVVRVYYVDASRTGGSVTYQWTVDPSEPPVQTGDTHSVGAVSIPAVGTKAGAGVRGPGYVNDSF